MERRDPAPRADRRGPRRPRGGVLKLLRRALAWIGWTLLGGAALAGIALAALATLAELPATRPLVAARVVRFLDDAIDGSLALRGLSVLPRGGIELHGLEVFDPDGHLVLQAGRARLFVDVTSLRTRTVGVTLELESPSVLLEEEPGGGLSISRAFAPTRRGPERPGGGPGGGLSWTVHLSRVTVRGGDVWWVDARGATRLEASGLDLDGRAVVGPGRAEVDLDLRGSLDAPIRGPVALAVTGGLRGSALRVPALRAEVGGTVLSAVAEGDLARRTGRAAVTRLGLAREVARALSRAAPAGGDLSAQAYGESDGRTLTLAVRVEPAAQGAHGRADAAVAARVSAPASAFGFDAVLEGLDPSRVIAAAPPGALTLAARGAASGRTLRDLRARLTATVQRSRLRKGEIARAEIVARAQGGALEVSRATASAPGLELDGTFRWREGGEVAGRIGADAKDLSAAVANLGALLGERLPAVEGRGRFETTLAGTSAEPRIAAAIDAPAFRIGWLGLAGARLTADLAGPAARPSVRIEGRVAEVRGGADPIARGATVRGAVEEGDATLSLQAALPGFRDPASLEASGRLSPGWETLALAELAFAYPGARWTLASPAAVVLEGPSVDRLELVSGAQRVAVTGGILRRGPAGAAILDAKVEVADLDLGSVPAGLLPGSHALRGTLGASIVATGTPAQPDVEGRFSLAGGALDDLDGLSLSGTAGWSGAGRRLRASLAASRAAGGGGDVELDAPLPVAGRPAERLLVRARAREVRLEQALEAAGSELPAAGELSLDGAVEGTVGAPRLTLRASVSHGEWDDLDGLGLEVTAEDQGERLRLGVRASLEGKEVASLDAEAPLDLGALLQRPADSLRAARAAPIEGSLTVRALDLAALSGRAGFPAKLAGTVDGAAAISGSLAALRAKGSVDLRSGAWGSWRELSGRAEVRLADAETSARGRLAIAGDEAVRFEVSAAAPVERLGTPRALSAAPIHADVTVPRLALAGAGSPDSPLGGTVSGHLAASGTARAPEVTVTLAGDGLTVEGRPLGGARLDLRYAVARTAGKLRLASATGGTLEASLAASHDFGLGAAPSDLRDAPAELTAVATALDLGFLPAVAPGLLRSAGGTLSLDLRAKGPLARLVPAGTLRVEDGKVGVADWGDWTGIAVEASVDADAARVTRLEVHRGPGKLTATGSLAGLRAADGATLEAHLASDGLAVAHAGMEVARVDLRADATGKWDGRALALDVRVPQGVVHLPKRQPRELQSIETRKDIVVGRRAERRRRTAQADLAPAAADPFVLRATVLAEKNLFVKSDDPRIDVELRANVTWEHTAGADYAQGSIEVIRGSLEPIAGRTFVVERGRVQFTGGPPSAATLDFLARYDNPAAVVTVNVEGPARSSKVHFTSEPSMAEPEIAMLIATGRTDLKAGAGGVATLSGEDAGKAALGVLATQAFKDLVADKLPVDTVAVEAGGFKAGKYLTDKIYVVYSRRFDADPLRGENTDEVRVEYQITPRWMFESRYGNAQSGGANLIWSREY